jgi:hypothetical protein
VWYDESVQINIYLDPSKTYFQMTTYNPEVRLDVIYPVVYIHMYAALTEANADQVKGTSRSVITRYECAHTHRPNPYTNVTRVRTSDSLYLGFKAEVIIFWVLVGLGGFLLLLSLPSLFVLLLCLKADRYAHAPAVPGSLNGLSRANALWHRRWCCCSRGSYFEFTRTGDGDLAYNPLINDTGE